MKNATEFTSEDAKKFIESFTSNAELKRNLAHFRHWLYQKHEDYYFGGCPEEADAISGVINEFEERFDSILS